MILNSFLTAAFIVGALDYILEKYELKKKIEKPKEETKWEQDNLL